MSKHKKDSYSKEKKAAESSLSLSVIVPVKNNYPQLDLFLDSIGKIKKPFEKDYQLIFTACDPDKIAETLNKYPVLDGLISKKIISVLPVQSDRTDMNSLQSAFHLADKNYVLIFDIGSLERSFNFEEIFSINGDQISRSKVLFPVFRDQERSFACGRPLILADKVFLQYFFSLAFSRKCDFMSSFLYTLEKLEIQSDEIEISQVSPLRSVRPSGKGFFRKVSDPFLLFLNWFILIPVKEIRTRPEKHFSFITVPSWFRLLFVATAFIIAILLPILSLQAGISGDEEKHYVHAGKVFNYFASRGEDKSALSDPENKLNYYGQSFDLFTYVVNRIFSVDKIYEVRHILNSISGFFIILFAGLLASLLAGYRAGFITMILIFFAPCFLGHSFNNSLDIPFALGYIFTIYQIIRFLKKLPRFSYSAAAWICIGIAWTISIRIGGLILIPYAFMFAGLYLLVNKWEFKLFSREGYLLIRKGIILLILISVAAFFLGLVLWPYGLQKPFKNPLEALRLMSNITVAIRVLFNGEIFWSNKLPWYYYSMYIFYTVPVLILLSFFTNILVYKTYRTYLKPTFIFFLFFAVIFPLAYVIYKESNVYGGWRHILFIFPPMVVIAGITLDSITRILKSRYLKYAMVLVILAGIAHPMRYIIANHPFEYIYFNEIMGNVKKAYGRFENDYYLNSLRQGSEWLIENILPGVPADTKIRVATNASVNYYFRHHTDKVATQYTRYYDRGAYDWDYAVYFCNYIDPYQLKNNIWPPYKTIHTIEVDHVPICAVVKRESKKDLEGLQLLDQRNYVSAIPILEEVIRKEPYNEIVMLRLGEAYIQMNQFDDALRIINKCLGIYPDYDKALNLKGIAYMQQEQYNEAISTFIYIVTKVNYRFITSYHNLALIYLRKNDPETAKNYLRKAIDINNSFKPAYLLMADILNRQGLTNEAKQYMQIANTLE
jgi:tetratricopeptide (TPR) repeat protein